MCGGETARRHLKRTAKSHQAPFPLVSPPHDRKVVRDFRERQAAVLCRQRSIIEMSSNQNPFNTIYRQGDTELPSARLNIPSLGSRFRER